LLPLLAYPRFKIGDFVLINYLIKDIKLTLYEYSRITFQPCPVPVVVINHRLYGLTIDGTYVKVF